MASEVPFRQLFCRAVGCGLMFFICQPCYRGQVYCSDQCRRMSRQRQRRKANQRYQQDPEVREDHRERMRAYRQTRRQSRVTDQSSIIDCGSGSISGPLVKTEQQPPAEETWDAQPKPERRERLGRIVCIICGRVGKFVRARMRRE